MSQQVQDLEFPELRSAAAADAPPLLERDMDLIGHVDVELVVEMGVARISIRKLFELKEGDVIPLIQTVEDPVLLRVNGKPIARGQLMAVDDNLAVKIEEIL